VSLPITSQDIRKVFDQIAIEYDPFRRRGSKPEETTPPSHTQQLY